MPKPLTYAILADIHGNLPAFEAVLADIDVHGGVDGLLVAGDVLGGPGQVEILRRLSDLRAGVILGNWDHRILTMADGSAPAYYYTASQFALVRRLLRDLSAEALEFLRALPQQLTLLPNGAEPIRMVHGSPRHIAEKVAPQPPEQLDEVLSLVPEPVVIFAHTHRQWQAQRSGRLALNPGAVSGPFDGRGAQYAFLTWDGCRWSAELKHILYDFSAVGEAYRQSGLLDIPPLPQLFLYTLTTGHHIEHDFMGFVNQKMVEAGCPNCPFVPDEIWEGAAREFLLTLPKGF